MDDDLKIELDLRDFSIGDWEAIYRGLPATCLPVLDRIVKNVNGVAGVGVPQALRALHVTKLIELIRAVDSAVNAEVNQVLSGKN
jgi:hypothetical protein